MNDKPADQWTYRTAYALGKPVIEVTDEEREQFICSHRQPCPQHIVHCSPCAGHALQSDIDEALES